MSWFRRSDASIGVEELKKTVQEEPKTSTQLRDDEVHGFLESSLHRLRETRSPEVVRLQGPSVCRRLYGFVEKRTIQTIQEWFTVKSMDFGESDPDRVYVLVGSMLDQRAGAVKVTDDRLVQGDVDNWVDHWNFKGFTKADALDAVVHDLDGAAEHRRRILELKARKDKEDRYDRVMKERVDLDRVISRLSKTAAERVDYADRHYTADEIAEESIYADFAAKLRESGLDESTVFDMVSGLSTLVQQSWTILPKLTAGTVKQFEARVLLPYYDNLVNAWNEARHEEYLQQERESAEWDLKIADLDSAGNLQQITSQLSTLSTILSDQAHDVSRIKWLELIDGLLGH